MQHLRTVTVFRDAKRTLLAIESVEFGHAHSGHSCHLYARLTPLVVIERTSHASKVLTVGTHDTSLASLRARHPELDELIRRACYEAPEVPGSVPDPK